MDKKRIIKKLFWDRHTDVDYMLGLMDGQPERVCGDRIDLYRRFLTTCDWYTILEIFPSETIKTEILHDDVINRLYPKELKEKYQHARKILSQ
jgi:hypothetical protein